MLRRRVKDKGFTLVEVLIAVAFIALVYSFVVQLFFGGFKDINVGDIQEESARLANNELIRLSSIENPLYIYLLELPDGAEIIYKLKAGIMMPNQLVEEGIITLKTTQTVGQLQDSSNNSEMRSSSATRANYTRLVEWTVEDVDPVLVGIKVTVAWSDPRGEIKDGEYFLETQLTN